MLAESLKFKFTQPMNNQSTPIDTKTRKHFKKKVLTPSGEIIVDAIKELRSDCVITFFKVGASSCSCVDNDLRSF